MAKKIVYSEPPEYIPKEIRKKYKLGEFFEKEQEAEKEKSNKEQEKENAGGESGGESGGGESGGESGGEVTPPADTEEKLIAYANAQFGDKAEKFLGFFSHPATKESLLLSV